MSDSDADRQERLPDPSSDQPDAESASARPSGRSRMAVVAAAVVVLAGLGVGGGVLLWDEGDGPGKAAVKFADLPSPCEANPGILFGPSTQWATGMDIPGEYDETGQVSCTWLGGIASGPDKGAHFELSLLYRDSYTDLDGVPAPITVKGAPSASAAGDDFGDECRVQWRTSFGSVIVVARMDFGNQPQDICADAAEFAAALKPRPPE
ncbi:hypothetical protein [Streptomyces sp. NPDC093591]|uniref:hypothetical protein n=1 Tax=Streptomyces sp. NPDC093591 TaxID=3366044 RepID=UPI0038175A39